MVRPSKGWHVYWKDPGDTGSETEIAWHLPAGSPLGGSDIRCRSG